jgi:hypothetical protein
MPSDLVQFWQRCDLSHGPFAHPDDWPVPRSGAGRHIDEETRGVAEFLSGPRFGDFSNTRFHLSLLPIPYGGDLSTAEIVVLLLNPGFSFTDYYAETCVPEFRRCLERNLRQDFSGVEFPFLWLDPEYCWHSGFVWWERKLRQVITVIAEQKFRGRYYDALRDVSRRLAHVELIPYHSQSFKAHRLIKALPSVNAAKRFAHTALAEAGNKGMRTIIITRQAAAWGLARESHRLVVYEGGSTRGASLGSSTSGGRAILAHYHIQSP